MLKNALQSGIRGMYKITTAPFKEQGPHITRFYMYEKIKDSVDVKNKGRVLSISHSIPLCEYLSMDELEIVEANYPEHNLLNLEAFQEDDFDYVICDQVLEHVEGSPQKAVDECYRVLKPGGTLVLTTCFINPIHMDSDFWRFTPDGLKILCKQFSGIVTSGGWGNSYVGFLERMGLRFVSIPKSTRHPMHKFATINHKKIPTVTWIIAKK
ncbi:class I SAM-dependent methyltransferase [Clostridium sp. BNL1100]|uniref:class I SAM-dependent methyltransferase n=1 Tax=Clostridium sp. BNL1100 TaxID=755731 RepID=UPI00031E7488|nr:class I SAM-dependent methyltransferase [Clostridium sp. BNL1100]